jgi:hypothetical protein
MADYFDVEVYATRLNFYPDATSWKPFHHDSHAYAAGHAQREDFTMGASFGGTRELIFKHVGSGVCFTFPQADGDVFAFDSIVNKQFQHGVGGPVSRREVGAGLKLEELVGFAGEQEQFQRGGDDDGVCADGEIPRDQNAFVLLAAARVLQLCQRAEPLGSDL